MVNSRRQFPMTRLRRSRMDAAARRLVLETRFSANQLIWPLFVQDSTKEHEPIPAMPGVFRYNLRSLKEALEKAASLGIGGVMLFPVVEARHKDARGSYALSKDNFLRQALMDAKAYRGRLCIITDCALDPYTSHGHDGVLNDAGQIDNDATLDILAQQSCLLANYGADTIAPSDMMDGRIGKIRTALDQQGDINTRLMSYCAKYASAYYGPFREAIGTRDLLKGNKRSYQLNPGNRMEAIHEAALDVEEGADWLIIKPGLPYLDILSHISTHFALPTFAYQVSGEYQMLYQAMETHSDHGARLLMETTLAFFRAGAQGLISYFAPQIAQLTQQHETGHPQSENGLAQS